MKLRSTILVLFLGFSLNSSAQISFNVQLPDSGTTHTYSSYQIGVAGNGAGFLKFQCRWEGEENIDGVVWRRYSYYSENSEEAYRTQFYRQEDNRWYVKNTFDSIDVEEFVVYDWNGQVGDTIVSNTFDHPSFNEGVGFEMEILDIENVVFADDVARRVFTLVNVEEIYTWPQSIKWVEGLGNFSSSMENAAGNMLIDNDPGTLMCIQRDGELIYEIPEQEIPFGLEAYENCNWDTTLSLEDFTESDIKLFPNPTQGAFFIDGIPVGSEVVIHNALGQKYARFTAPKSRVALDIAESGIYSITIFGQDYNIVKRVVLD